jgi:membrane peptidoglycan carboxypeptidase
VIEAVKREFLANPAFGETREERLDALFGGGLHIETTLDVFLQEHAREVVQEHVAALGGPTAALVSVEPGTGRILALSGGGEFEDRKFDVATQSRRQPGSAFKTFALIAALEEGVELNDRFEGNSPDEHDLPAGQVWQVHNFGGARLGQVDLREALVRSVNTAFAELTLDLGHERVIDVATRLGIAEQAFGEPTTHGPAVSLGGLTHGVSPLEMAAAYAALASQGRYAAPFLVERVTGPDGEVVFEQEIAPVRAIDPEVAATTLDVLEEAVDYGTGRAAALGDWPVAGKTGTTQNSADAWFIGTVPHLATAVWVGHPDERTPIPGLTGGAASAPLWRDYMTYAVADAEPSDFPD